MFHVVHKSSNFTPSTTAATSGKSFFLFLSSFIVHFVYWSPPNVDIFYALKGCFTRHFESTSDEAYGT